MRKEAMLYEGGNDNKVKCYLCNHRCIIGSSKFGICGVRQNVEGKLYTLVYGEAIASHIDPIEKKPLYHFFPGSLSYSIATMGCNFKCGFCQNWQISQLSKRESVLFKEKELMPKEVVKQAKENKCLSISYTYTEPTIFFEYAYDTAKLAKREGIYNNFVTNGYMTKEALDTIQPYLDAANVDLKSFSEDYYRNICKANLQPILDSIRYMKELGIWVEVTTLIIPGENDSDSELSNIAKFIAQLGKDIPWHISRFHPDYQFSHHQATPIERLRRAKEIGKSYGLRYIYLGNVYEGFNTYCYSCGELLVERGYFSSQECKIEEGKCPFCGSRISGIWSDKCCRR
jgi:pyruvate formate lyase activating enzyme